MKLFKCQKLLSAASSIFLTFDLVSMPCFCESGSVAFPSEYTSVKCDAFHMVMYDLRLRHHVRKVQNYLKQLIDLVVVLN